MHKKLVGKWVEVTLINGKVWVGILEEWDDEALFISNGHKFGTSKHKGAECTNNEVSKVVEATTNKFLVS